MDESVFLSPEKRDALRKLREQEVALDKQSFAIQSALARLDTAYVQHTTIGSSLYSSIINRDYHPLSSARTPRYGSSDRTGALQNLYDKFVEHVEVTNNFQLPHPAQLATARRPHIQDTNNAYDPNFAWSNDENESYVGVDVLSHTRKQLHRIKEQRAATLAERLQQKQEALIAAEQARLDALHEVRHRAAMEVAGRHLVHRRCWVAVKRMYRHAKLRSNYSLAEYKWKVVTMMSVLNRLVKFARMNSMSEGPYLALRQRAGWRQFCNNARRLAEEHLLDIECDLVAQSFRAQRSCRRVLAELFRTAYRRRLTAAKIDHFNLTNAGRRALATMKERLLGQHDDRMARAGRVRQAELRRQEAAFAALRQCALRGQRHRAIAVADDTDRGAHALRCLEAFARRGAHLSHCMHNAEGFHSHFALSQALAAWRSSTTLRAHRRYCAGLAAAHSRDICRRTGSPGLRDRVRGYLARWYERAERSRRWVQPLRQYRNKRDRQKVQAALREWRQKTVQARLQRRAASAKVRLLQLRRGWAWYRQQRGVFVDRARAHKAALLRSRNLLRSTHLAEGFADFRAYVLANREKRLAVKQERHQRARADMAVLLARLRRRLQTRSRRSSAVRARLQALVRCGFWRWKIRAGLRLVAEGRSQRQQLRAQRLSRGWTALRETARARALRRTHAKKALLKAGRQRKCVALLTWVDWSTGRAARGAAYQTGKMAWREGRLRSSLQQWMAVTALAKQLMRNDVFHVRPSAARRRSFLHRWVDFLQDVRTKRDHQRSYGRDREHAQMREFLRRLRNAVRCRAEENQLLATYREHTLVPLLQSRFFTHMLWRRAVRQEEHSDPRRQHHERRSGRAALRAWRLFRRGRLASTQSLRLGDRNHQIVSCLQAITRWRNLTRLHCSMIEAARQAARLYRRRYFAPAFKNWLRNTAALAHQFDARYLQHGDLFRKALARRVVAAFRRNHSVRRRLRQCAVTARAHTTALSLRCGLDKLLTVAGRLRLLAVRKNTARTHRAMALKRSVFRELVQNTQQEKNRRAIVRAARARHNLRVLHIVFSAFQKILRESETPGFGRACRYEVKRSLRLAWAVLKARLVWRHRSRRSAPHLSRRLMQQGLEALKRCRRQRLHSKGVRNRAVVHFRAALCRRYLARWLSNRFSRRGAAAGGRVAVLRTNSLADIWSFGAGGGSARLRSASTVSVASLEAPVQSSPGRSLRRQNSGTLSVTMAPAPQATGRGPTRSLSIVRRRTSVNASSFAQYRRCQQAVSALVAHTFRRRQEKEELLKMLKSMAAFQARACFAQWTAWVQDVVAEKLEAIHGDVHFERRLLTQVLPAMRRLVMLRRRVNDAKEHRLKSLLSLGWRRWSKYACTGLRRAVAQARAQQRAREREAGRRAAPQYLDDDFSHRRSSLLGSPGSPSSGMNASVVAAAAEPRDHRVTVQRARLRHAEVMHLLHAAVHALARWRHWSNSQHQHRRLVHACLQRQLEAVFERFQQHAQRKKHRRAALRTSLHWRRHSLLRRSFAALKQHRQDSLVTRRLHGMCTARIFRLWKGKVAFRGLARQHLLALEDVYRARKLQAAFAEWRQDTAVEAALVQGLGDLRRHRLHHGVDHLIYNRKVRRRSAALQLRSRKFKTHRLLRKVFTNILAEMSVRYRSVEVLRECALYHLRYHCRRVLYNLFYLRRNRIAKDHNLTLKFRALVGALRTNRDVTRYDRANMGRANNVILRKALWWLFRRAKQQKVTSRRLRSLQPPRAGTVHHSAALDRLSRTRAMERALRRLGANIARRRKHRRQLKRCAYACIERHVRRCFRLLLSHSRRGSLRRRNSQALYSLFVNLQLRRAVSRLDVNVSHRWAVRQERRLMQAYSAARGKARVLRLLDVHGLDSASATVVRHALGGLGQDQDVLTEEHAVAHKLACRSDQNKEDTGEGYSGLDGLEERKEWTGADDTLLRSQ